MSASVTMSGAAYVIGGNVDTDTIIKSRHCVSADAQALAPHCLAELRHPDSFVATGPYPLIACNGTFGVGSARVQAPLSLAGAGVKAVVARAFAPIFFENCINGALVLPLVAPLESWPSSGTILHIEVSAGEIRIRWGDTEERHRCSLPAWALAGQSWMDIIASEATQAGGLEALRARGLDLD
jgi:3-isopropylmalate/(R)-2-methylmalate dehydratase small subunit